MLKSGTRFAEIILRQKPRTVRGENAMSSLESTQDGYRLTTAEILYHVPQQPHLLQSFIWQDYDMAPSFPELQRFLEFWNEHVAGTLHSVRVASLDVTPPPEMMVGEISYTLH